MVHRDQKGSGPERGASLVEVMIYLAVMAILGVPLSMMTVSVSRSSAEGDMLSKILERNRSAMARLVSEYRTSLRGTTVISNGGKAIQFTTSAGFNGVGPIAGPSIRYEIRLDPREALNGLDDNNNGLVDESILVRVNPAINEEIVLASGLISDKCLFVANGSGVNITLTTGGWTKGATAITESQRLLTVYPRN